MNEHTPQPRSQLGRLLDEATAHYNPQPDAARFEQMLLVHHRRRTGMILWSAAAGLALIGGAAFAFNGQPNERRLSPADSQVDDSESTNVKTTVYRPNKTDPDGGYDPIDKTKITESTVSAPNETASTEKTKDSSPTTAPKTTVPKTTTVPTTTDPDDGETTTTDADGTWSAHQMYGSSDADPPSEVFWGTANIGDKIQVESAYGSVTVFADAIGDWDVHITFTGAPVGVAFEVWVHAPYHDEVFYFTYLG